MYLGDGLADILTRVTLVSHAGIFRSCSEQKVGTVELIRARYPLLGEVNNRFTGAPHKPGFTNSNENSEFVSRHSLNTQSSALSTILVGDAGYA